MADCRSTWASLHAFRRARAAESAPEDPIVSDEEFEREARERSPHFTFRRWLATDHGRVVGSLAVSVTTPESPAHAENSRFAYAGVSVLGPWRQRGIGTRLIAQLHRVMCEEDRALVNVGTTEADGHAVLHHMGACEKLRMIESRLRMDEPDWDKLDAQKNAILAANPDLVLEAYSGRVPLDVYEPLLPALSALFEDTPVGDLERGRPRVHIDEVREFYGRLDRFGGAHHFVMLRAPDGGVAGVADVLWDGRLPRRAWHSFTGVDRARRGRKLAQALKIAVLQQVRTAHPSLIEMGTANAAQNAPMLAVNAKLGFRRHRTHGAYQIGRDELGAWAAAHGLR
jgi:GNAT superfamily N-acetyltransferase